jgi:hypothetical protein
MLIMQFRLNGLPRECDKLGHLDLERDPLTFQRALDNIEPPIEQLLDWLREDRGKEEPTESLVRNGVWHATGRCRTAASVPLGKARRR